MTTRAFTLVELIAVIVILVIIVVVLLPATGRRHHGNYRQVKDGVQIRSIQQSMVTWAGQNQDNYPIPSDIDLNDTIPGTDTQTAETEMTKYGKDVPRFVMSLLIYNGFFGPEIAVSPAEVNEMIKADPFCEFKNPTGVAPAKRAKAILDPGFACYPDEPGGDIPIPRASGTTGLGGFSYAIVPFVGARRAMWQSTFDASQVVLGNRGPWYKLDTNGKWSLDPTDRRGKNITPATASNSLLIHGARNSWEGNVARNDNSVSFETRPDPENLTIKYGAGLAVADISKYDNIFANEDENGDGKLYSRDDDRITPANVDKRKNNYLRCWGGDGKGSNLTIDPATKQITSIIDFWYD
ncbi:MAG: hypothetical protein KF805_06530 [Phycisphaeraceae bacterium]|nr:hypothetical protein [Phycisphaeraceae bacterium]